MRFCLWNPVNFLNAFSTLACTWLLTAVFSITAADFHRHASDRYAGTSESGSVLPGGRTLKSFGKELETGPAPSAIAISPKGLIATADLGPERLGITFIEPPAKGIWRSSHVWARTPGSRAPEKADPDWEFITDGLAFDGERALWVSEGVTGRLRLLDPQTGDRRKLISIRPPGSPPAHSGELAVDPVRRILCALDTANARLVVVDARNGRLLSTLGLNHVPASLALSEDGLTAWISQSPPGGSLDIVDLRNPAKPLLLDPVPLGTQTVSRLLAAAGRIFAVDPGDDSVLILSPGTRQVVTRIPLRIPLLNDALRGIAPAGLAYDHVSNWLLVAESGINAVGVIDLATNQLIGHIPCGWMPVRVTVAGDRVYVANRNGHGAGPRLRLPLLGLGEVPTLSHGSVTTFIVPPLSELAALTATVLESNGLLPDPSVPAPLPPVAKHVVLITTEGRTFDEVLGDIIEVRGTRVTSFGPFARFGMHGIALGATGQFSVHGAAITPNLHAIARLGAFSDNYYSESDPPASEDTASLLRHVEAQGARTERYDSAPRFLAAGAALPALTWIDVPRPAAPPGRYEASFAAAADLAIGRIVESLSKSPDWNETVVVVAASAASTTGLDHIDSRRTLFLAAGPSVKRTVLSRTNASFPTVMRTVLELLRLPPLGLRDATAPDLRDLFTTTPNPARFTAIAPDPRVYSAP